MQKSRGVPPDNEVKFFKLPTCEMQILELIKRILLLSYLGRMIREINLHQDICRALRLFICHKFDFTKYIF